MVRPDPCDARFASDSDRRLGGFRHHQMAHAVIAIHESGGGRRTVDADGRRRVDSTFLDAVHILRKAKHPMGVRTRQVGLGHEAAYLLGVGFGKAQFHERRMHQFGDGVAGDRCGRVHAAPALACSAEILRVSPVSTSVRVASTDA